MNYKSKRLLHLFMRKNIFIRLFVFLTLFASALLNAQSNSHYEKALQSFNQNEYNESYIHLKNALKENPENLAAKILMGKMLLINGYYDAANIEFEEALVAGADPNLVIKQYGKSLILDRKFHKILKLSERNVDVDTHFELKLLKATAYTGLAEFGEAKRQYQLALLLQVANTRALNGLANLLMDNEDFDSARNYVDKSLQANNENANTWRLDGILHKRNGHPQQALSSFKRAFELDSQNAYVLRSYASALWDNKQIGESQKVVELILTQTPNDPNAIILQSQIFTAIGKEDQAKALLSKLSQDLSILDAETRSENLSLRFTSGISAYLNQNYEQALSDINYYISKGKLNVATIGMMADTYIRLGKERSAFKLLQTHEEIVIDDLNISLLLCGLYIKNNRSFKCDSLSQRLKQKYPDQPRVDFIRAKTFVARRKMSDALDVLDGIQHAEYQHQKELAKAHLYFQMEDYAAAHIIAAKLMTAMPNDIAILNLNVALQSKKGEWQMAEELVDQVLQNSPSHIAARYNKANILAAEGDYPAALAIMQSLEKESTLVPNAYILFTHILSSMGMHNTAIEKLESISKYNEKTPQVSETLIELYRQTEQFDKALDEIDYYTRKHANDDKYLLIIATIYLKQSRITEAKAILDATYDKWIDEPKKLGKLSKMQIRIKDEAGYEQSLLRILTIANNRDLSSLLQLAQLYSKQKKSKLAEKHISLAQKYYPKNINQLTQKIFHYNIASMILQ